MRWQGRDIVPPWSRRETRATYSDSVIRHLQQRASGVSASPLGLAVTEIAAGLWSRGLASARVTPASRSTAALTPPVLAAIGSDLVRLGESIWSISVDEREGRVKLLRASAHEVTGGPDPARWQYALTLGGPSTPEEKTLPGESVIHARINEESSAPWRGRSPLTLATDTGELGAQLERSLAHESGGPVGYLIPVPQVTTGGEENPLSALKLDIQNLQGGVSLVETTAGGWEAGRSQAPRHDWRAARIGPVFPSTSAVLRDSVSHSLLSACGVPPALAVADSDGTGQRESWRRFQFSTLQPVARIIASELAEKLAEPSLDFDFRQLFASDLAGRARAYKALRESGLEDSEAREICGF